MYAFIDDGQTIEEISQLRISDILREFPDFSNLARRTGCTFDVGARENQSRKFELRVVPPKADLRRNPDTANPRVVGPTKGRLRPPDPDTL